MKLAQLRYFLEVYRMENLTQAANNLHISQPSVTVAIRELEQELGVNLFYRTKQRIYPTDAGHLFYNRLENIIGNLDHLALDMKNLVTRQIIKLGVSPMTGSMLLPSIYKRFTFAHPEIDFDMIEDSAPMVQKLLVDEQLDFAFLLGGHFDSSEIEFVPLQKCPYALCVHPSHPLSKREVISVKDIVNEPLASFGQSHFVNVMVTEAFHEIGAIPNIVFISKQIDTLKRFVMENLACSILFEDCVFDSDPLSKVYVKEFPPIYVGIGWKKKRIFTEDAKQFIHFAKSLACEVDV